MADKRGRPFFHVSLSRTHRNSRRELALVLPGPLTVNASAWFVIVTFRYPRFFWARGNRRFNNA